MYWLVEISNISKGIRGLKPEMDWCSGGGLSLRPAIASWSVQFSELSGLKFGGREGDVRYRSSLSKAGSGLWLHVTRNRERLEQVDIPGAVQPGFDL